MEHFYLTEHSFMSLFLFVYAPWAVKIFLQVGRLQIAIVIIIVIIIIIIIMSVNGKVILDINKKKRKQKQNNLSWAYWKVILTTNSNMNKQLSNRSYNIKIIQNISYIVT